MATVRQKIAATQYPIDRLRSMQEWREWVEIVDLT
jgi:hypothetical protein